jgi:hypothetical protein
MNVTTKASSNVVIRVELTEDEQFDYTERWGSQRTFRVHSLGASGNPETGLLSGSVSPYGLNIKKDGTLGQQRLSYGSIRFADLPEAVQVQIEDAFREATNGLGEVINMVRAGWSA